MNRNKGRVGLALLLTIVLWNTPLVHAQYLQTGVNYAPNKLIVAFVTKYTPLNPVLKDGIIVTGLGDVDNLNRQYGVTVMWQLFPKAEEHGEPAMAGYYSLTISKSQPLESVLEAYAKLPSVEHVEPIGIHRIYFNPNDPSLSSQWAITKIQARQAWDQTRGDSTVPLGIADTGVDWNHPDLANNIWYNFGEIPSDGIDNDGNGYIDDIRGWDWVTGVSGYAGEDDQTPDNNPMDFDGHGTHCSGIASAATNNSIGIAGVGFNCSIMCLRIGWKGTDGLGYVQMDFAASAMYYAGNEGAKAINCSWGSSNDGGISTAANYATSHGVQIVSAAGNDSSSVAPYLCTRSDVIAVAATDNLDHAAYFSNFGSWVDVCAPGVNIYSTIFDNSYAYMDGTSMAAPHVVGEIGLIRSIAPSMTRSQVQSRVISTAVNIDALNPGYAGLLGSGRINAYNAVNGLGISFPPPILVSPIDYVFVNNLRPRFTWHDTSTATHYHLQVDQSIDFLSPNINDSTLVDTTYLPISNLSDGLWYWRVRCGNGTIWSNFSEIAIFSIDTHAPTVPIHITPADNSWANRARPTFGWQASIDSVSGVYRYYLKVDSDSLFSPPYLVNDSTINLGYIPVVDLPLNSRLYWRVQAIDAVGNLSGYSTTSFRIDMTIPSSPIDFDATPDVWTADPNFTLNWTNPSDPSGIARAYYKIHTAPTSSYDTSGHLAIAPPVNFVVSATDSLAIFVWLADSAGNISYLQRASDTMRYDATPPSGCTASSPPMTASFTFAVNWSTGSDIGAGLSGYYDVRYRDGTGGSWTDWQAHVANRSASFTGLNNHTYYFEARTSDLVGNQEQFTGNPESHTTIDTTYVGPPFVPGDANGDGILNLGDLIFFVNYIRGGPVPDPFLAADANGDCHVNLSDIVYLVNYFSARGPAPFAGNCGR